MGWEREEAEEAQKGSYWTAGAGIGSDGGPCLTLGPFAGPPKTPPSAPLLSLSPPPQKHLSGGLSALREVSMSQLQVFPYAFLSLWASDDASTFLCYHLSAPPSSLFEPDIREAHSSSHSAPRETTCQLPQ